MEDKSITICEDPDDPETYGGHTFTFDHVYDQNSTQQTVFENTAKGVVESSLKGYNATIFAYGQTGTGKTYTMEGFNSKNQRGIIPRAIEQVFEHVSSNITPHKRFLVRASYLQIYNECISDLLKPERTNLAIREDKKRGVFVEGLSEWVVRSPEEIYGLMERGGAVRLVFDLLSHVTSLSLKKPYHIFSGTSHGSSQDERDEQSKSRGVYHHLRAISKDLPRQAR